MESVGEEDTLAQHPLVSSSELDLGNGEGMSKMETPVHVWVWKVSEPLGVLFLDLGLGEASELFRTRGADLEDTLFLPSILVFLLERLEVISLGRLEGGERALRGDGEDVPGPAQWSEPWRRRGQKNKDWKVASWPGTRVPLS